ncbi:hypothetical protein OG883_34540 [Streptomyces sp. NBC_01142]|uniref:hypothetical protein n=1 Tax=Streptomyces sp. NBC_01142 TaxID=2975865 RepID=UPI00224ED4CE|nr:hypothetical protein [Streptomyces sp. NBC_01142]MCX4824886.1 hypothetical protein [Streptomyces sp. NBC_01142]
MHNAFSFTVGGRRVELPSLEHVPPKLRTSLEKALEAREAIDTARKAEETCGHGTGPKRAKYETAVTEAREKAEAAFTAAADTANATAGEWVTYCDDGYRAAMIEFEKARETAAAALEKAAGFARVKPIATSKPYALAVDRRLNGKAVPTLSFMAGQLREFNAPGIDD